MIELSNVSYRYPGATQPALANLSLTIEEGEFVVVCGPSGAGKSTFLRLLNGLVPHFYGGEFGGDVRVWGRSTRAHQPRDLADVVGFVFQNPEAQFVVDVVEDEIVFAMENLGVVPRLMRRRVEEVLDQLGIAHLRRRRVSSLSGGEQQRVAIAAVLAAQPHALVLDEPTSQLDPHAAEEVLTALQKLNDDLGLTIVLCEHRLERVVQYADRLIYFGKGQGSEVRGQGSETTFIAKSKDIDPLGHPHPSSLPCAGEGIRPPLPPGEGWGEGINSSALRYIVGPPRDVFRQIDLAPPLVQLAKRLDWVPLPLTIKEGRKFVTSGQRSAVSGQGPEPRGQGFGSSNPESYTQYPIPNTLTPNPSIRVSQIHVTYGEHEALYNLSLEARAGEVLALMGRNGSGKTTLLKTLVGLIRPQRGKIAVLGRDLARTRVEDMVGVIGYVPQDPRTILFHDTLREELAFTLHAASASGEKVREPRASSVIEQTLDVLGIAHLAGAYPRDLSGGEAQRAALAAVLVASPPLLLLDEPTRGLDYTAKGQLGHLLRALAAAGRTIILATHDVEMVAACADRVALLGEGELVLEGPTREVLSDSLTFSPQIAKLFPHTGWLTPDDVLG